MEENKYGEYAQAIIGCSAEEGYSFNHIQHINYNISMVELQNGTNNSENIINRINSHKYLTKKDFEKIRIHLLINEYINKNKIKSIDLKMYKICSEKDIEIKKITRYIKENCFDSKLHYDRINYKKEYKEFTRECDYGLRSLKCDIIKESERLNKSINGKDKSTFNLFFLEKIKKIDCRHNY